MEYNYLTIIFLEHFINRVIKKRLTTFVLVKIMKVNFPFPFSVHHVMKKLFIIQEAISVFVIRINETLKGNIHVIAAFYHKAAPVSF